MSKILSIFLFILSLSAVSISETYAQPVAVIDNKSYDAGIVKPQTTVSHDYIITNQGDQDLILENVKTTCGCNAAIPSATTIVPNAIGIISAKMSTGSLDSKLSKSVILYTNDPNNKEIRMDIKAEVQNVLFFEPETSFDFGNIPYNQIIEKTLYLKSRDGKEFTITEPRASHPSLKLSVGEPDENGIPITLSFQPNKAKGRFYNTIQITSTHPDQPIFQSRIMANVLGPVEFTPATLFFGTVQPGQIVNREVKAKLSPFVHAKNREDWQITKIELDNNQIIQCELKPIEEEKGSIDLVFTLTAPDKIGYLHGVAKIYTAIDDFPVVEMNYSAMVRK